MAAWAVAPTVEGHDDKAVLREGSQSRYRRVVPVPWECERLFISVVFLWVHEAAEAPPAYLRGEKTEESSALGATSNFYETLHECKREKIPNE